MKVVILVTFLLAIFVANAQPQIENSGFEAWDGVGSDTEEPGQWSSIKTSDAGSFVNGLAPQVCYQSSDAHTGNYSTRLISMATLLPNVYANGTLTCGRVHASLTPSEGYVFTDQGNTNWNQTMTSRPDSLTGWYKASPVGNDPGKAHAIIHIFDSELPDQGNSANWVGEARFDLPGSTVNSWTRFSVPFDYYNAISPSFILLVLTGGDSLLTNENTEALFDDVALIYNVTPLPSTSVAYVTPSLGFDFTVNFVSGGTPNSSMDFNVELSDASGNFASPTIIGSTNTTLNIGIINCTVPAGTTAGTGYKLRVNTASSFYAPIEVPFEVSSPLVRVSPKVLLEGPFDGTSQMLDDLRSDGYIPLDEPFTDLGYTFTGGGGESISASILTTTGNNAIVDWMILELRDKNNSATILSSRSVLVQADGDVVDMDGTSSVAVSLGDDDYFVALRHRNHLGVMALSALSLSNTTTIVDFSLPGTSTYGTNAQVNISGVMCMWMGNSFFDAEVKYTGLNNDRDPILVAIGGIVPTASITGYLSTDCNMDGTVKYTGLNNDRDPILVNIGGTVPTDVRTEQLP